MPLTMIKTGETASIKKITGQDETRRHLENLGFVAGEAVTVISELGGSLILNVKGARIALGKAMARRIMI